MNFPPLFIRRGLLAAGCALAFSAAGLWLWRLPPPAPEPDLTPPAEAHLGVPGEITLRLCSWRRPQSESWTAAAPAGWEFTPWRCDWRGISAQGWQWQLSRRFWAVQFCPAGELTLHGPGQVTFTATLPAMQPREGLHALQAVTDAPATGGGHHAAGWFVALALLCVLTDLLGLLWRHSRPQARTLRWLASLRCSPDNALLLRRCWRSHSSLASGQRELSAQLDRLCFQTPPGQQELFDLVREKIRCALLRHPGQAIHHP
ncbi:MAG: hypothetical protein GX564_13300 [Oligosphaeraceae bacterium]|nr:hypothetical protein [Oligosphaeraceae bacterium]